MATKARTTIPFEDIEAELLADPETRAAYDALEPAYQIARLRIERGLTQAQLAALVGTKQPSIARFERGDSEPTLAFLRKLAEALGVRLEVSFIPVEQSAPAR
jgi:DNA-binding XRE family transcriptional regulator